MECFLVAINKEGKSTAAQFKIQQRDQVFEVLFCIFTLAVQVLLMSIKGQCDDWFAVGFQSFASLITLSTQ